MNTEQTLDLLRAGRDKWNAWANSLLEEKRKIDKDEEWVKHQHTKVNWDRKATANFVDHEFMDDLEIKGFTFPGPVNFSRSKFNGKVIITETEFNGVTNFSNSKFTSPARLEGNVFRGVAKFTNVKSSGAMLIYDSSFEKSVIFDESNFEENLHLVGLDVCESLLIRRASIGTSCLISSTKIGEQLSMESSSVGNELTMEETASLQGAILKETSSGMANLTRLDLSQANFQGAHLPSANFTNSNLEGTDFSGATLSHAVLLGTHMDTRTQFHLAKVDKCSINRYALECLENFGGLSMGARMKMDIRDDVAELRKNYSGLHRWLHILALTTFAFPYLWFTLERWAEARFLNSSEASHIPLWKAVSRFIYNGGSDWDIGYNFSPSFIFFCVALFFNALRGALLWKTNQLEFYEEVSGVPSEFSLTEAISRRRPRITWGQCLTFSKYAVIAYLFAVLLNAIHFTSMQVPIPVR